jgi:hypothetical protein
MDNNKVISFQISLIVNRIGVLQKQFGDLSVPQCYNLAVQAKKMLRITAMYQCALYS